MVAFVFCPLGAIFLAGGAFVRKGLRDTWDSLMFNALIKKRARVPIKDGFLAKRVAGPGLANHYFYQVWSITRFEFTKAYSGLLSQEVVLPFL